MEEKGNNKKHFSGPGWCGSVDWARCKPKGHWFNSRSGHMPGLQARSPVGGMWEATTHWCFSPSRPPFPCLKRNKNIFIKKKTKHICGSQCTLIIKRCPRQSLVSQKMCHSIHFCRVCACTHRTTQSVSSSVSQGWWQGWSLRPVLGVDQLVYLVRMR